MGIRSAYSGWRNRAALGKVNKFLASHGASLLGPGVHLSDEDLALIAAAPAMFAAGLSLGGFGDDGIECKSYTPAQLATSIRDGVQWSPYNEAQAVAQGLEQNVYVYRATTVKAQTASSVPIKVKVKDASGDWVAPEEGTPAHRMERLLAQPNPDWSWPYLQSNASYHTDLSGTSYWNLCRNKALAKLFPSQKPSRTSIGKTLGDEGLSEPTSIWATAADTYGPSLDTEGGNYIEYYKPKKRGLKRVENYDMIAMRLTRPGKPWEGMAPLEACWKDVQTETACAEYQKHGMDNMARIGGILNITSPVAENRRVVADQALVDKKADFEAKYKGALKANSTLVTYDGGVTYTDIAKTPKDIDFVNSRKFTRANIYTAFGVPGLLSGDLEGSTFANLEQSQVFFWVHTMIPWLNLVVTQLNKFLVPEFGKPDELRIELDLSSVDALWSIYSARVDTAVAMTGAGVPWKQANERCSLGLDPWPGWDLPPSVAPASAQLSSVLMRLGYSGNEINVSLRLGMPELPHDTRFAPVDMMAYQQCEGDFIPRGRKPRRIK